MCVGAGISSSLKKTSDMFVIEVLAGMDHNLFKTVGFADGTADGRRLDELRAGTDHREHLERHWP